MKKTDSNRLPLQYINARKFIPIVAFILFVIFQNTLSYFLFVFSIIAIMWCLYYENCRVFYTKSQNTIYISSHSLTEMIRSILYLPYLILTWWILTKGINIGLENFYQTDSILASEYLSGICWILASIVVYLMGKLFHNIVFKEMEKEAKSESGVD